MHTCLTLSNIGGHWYVEREVSGLISKLRSYCDSIDSSDISVEGPSGEGEARSWRVAVKLRVFDEIVRVITHTPEGSDAQQSLSRALADIYTRATLQLDHIAKRHGGCCAHGGGHDTACLLEACA
jgi:hypothetical protein